MLKHKQKCTDDTVPTHGCVNELIMTLKTCTSVIDISMEGMTLTEIFCFPMNTENKRDMTIKVQHLSTIWQKAGSHCVNATILPYGFSYKNSGFRQ